MVPSFCDGMRRRDFLAAGSLAGLSLADMLRLQSVQSEDQKLRDDVNCIFIFIVVLIR